MPGRLHSLACLFAAAQPRSWRGPTGSAALPTTPLHKRLRGAALSAAALLLASCSALPPDDSTQPAMPSNYGALISAAVKPYKSFAGYGNFEISAPRWVHAETGWNWLVCLRYDDSGHRRTFSLFIENDKVVSARYDVITDRCGEQQYVPFNPATGALGSSSQPLAQHL
jgi:hypothetical protein